MKSPTFKCVHSWIILLHLPLLLVSLCHDAPLLEWAHQKAWVVIINLYIVKRCDWIEWQVVTIINAARCCTHRGPRSPWRLPCRLLPTSLGLPQQGQSWKENCQCLLSSFLGHLGSRSLTWGGCRRSPCWPWSSPLEAILISASLKLRNLQIGIL